MSVVPYPAYKESGNASIGKIPSHWRLQPLKAVVANLESGTSVNAEDRSSIDGEVAVLKTSCVYTGKFDVAENKVVVVEDLHRVSCPLRPNSLIVSRMNTPDLVGATGLVEEITPGIFLPDRLWQISLINACSRYVYYWTKSAHYRNYIKSICSGSSSSMQNLSQGQFLSFPFFDCPLVEQKTIAAFLDRETGKIDALVAEQERLMVLLKEKRQAVISQAVTKGLDPNVPMKDSGVEWLGEVPAHWIVVALKHLVSTSIIDGPHETPQKFDEGVPFISAEAVSQGYINFEKKWGYISTDDHAQYSKRYKPNRGDILMVKLGATTGTVAIVETDVDFNIWVPIAAIKLKRDICSYFILNILRSRGLKIAYELNWTYGTQQTLGLSTISNLRIPMPPSEEQRDIVNFLDSELPHFDSLTTEAARAIALLKERRAALISAAVTGKIDVRGLVDAKAA